MNLARGLGLVFLLACSVIPEESATVRAVPFYQHVSSVTVSSGRYTAAGHSGRDASTQPLLMHGQLDGQHQEMTVLDHLPGFPPRAVSASDDQQLLLVGSQASDPGSGPLGHARYAPARLQGSPTDLRALPQLQGTSLTGNAQGWSHLTTQPDGSIVLTGIDHHHVVIASTEAAGEALRWWTPLEKARQVRDLLTTEQGIAVLLSDAVRGMQGQDWLTMLDHSGQPQWTVALDAPACDRLAAQGSDLLVACQASEAGTVHLHRYDLQGQQRMRSAIAVALSSARTTILSAQESGALLIAGVGMNQDYQPTLWGHIVSEDKPTPVPALSGLAGELSDGSADEHGWIAAGTEKTSQGGLGRVWAIALDGSLRWQHALTAP